MNLPVGVLLLVFLLIAFRQAGPLRLDIWKIMTAGAGVVVLCGGIGGLEALRAINLDVLAFLFGMFVVGQALEESGYLAHLEYHLFRHARTTDALILFILFGMGGASALLMNDTLAIIGTPLVLQLAARHHLPPKLLLFALAFAITTGSMMSPIGNPQNLLVAVAGQIGNPFVTFLKGLLLPAVLGLMLAYGMLRWRFHTEFHAIPLVHLQEPISDPELARWARVSLGLILILVMLKIGATFFGYGEVFRLTWIALAGAAPILLFSPKRFGILRRIDHPTLMFFAGLFVLMESVWRTGTFQALFAGWDLDLTAEPVILAVSAVLSQLISNVPMVALYLPVLQDAGTHSQQLLALAAGSTLAGNALVLGAASNVIIIQKAEKLSDHSLGFFEFARLGIPLTAVQLWCVWLLF